MQDGQNPEGQNPNEPKQFSEEYVKQLREEAKANRLQVIELKAELDKIKSQQEEITKKQAEEQGKFKELYEKELERAKQIQAEAESYKPFKEKHEDLEKQIRDDLLSKLDEKHKAIANDLTIDKLKTYVELNSASHNYDKGRTNGVNFQVEGKNWTDFTTKELEELRKANPQLVDKLYQNYLKTKK